MTDLASATKGSEAPAAAIERMLGLLESPLAPGTAQVGRGYLDLLGERDPTGSRPGQRLMLTRALPLVYQRFWRPIGGRFLMGATGPSTAEEHRMALEMLSIAPGARMLDVACGPGNFTRDFAAAVGGDGLAVGLDASASMLATAVRETKGESIAYVRGDACALPFRDGTFDAVCCFAALYLIEEPQRALEEIVRVLAPGGRVALMASCSRGPIPPRMVSAVRALSGVRILGRDELTGPLSDAGMVAVEQRVVGLAQFVSAVRPR